MEYTYPVAIGSTREQLERLARAVLRSEAKSVLDGYDAGQEVVLMRQEVVFRVRPDGSWALGLWGYVRRDQHDWLAEQAGVVPGVSVVPSTVFLKEWGFTARAGAAFSLCIYYAQNGEAAARARRGDDIFVPESDHLQVARLRYEISADTNGHYESTMSCEFVVQVDSKLQEQVATVVGRKNRTGGQMYLPVDLAAQREMLRRTCQAAFDAVYTGLVCFAVK